VLPSRVRREFRSTSADLGRTRGATAHFVGILVARVDYHLSARTSPNSWGEEPLGPWNDLGIADARLRCNWCVSLIGAFGSVFSYSDSAEGGWMRVNERNRLVSSPISRLRYWRVSPKQRRFEFAL
jgi:hypothetical protein